MKKRTKARELALQFLYQVDLLGPSALAGLEEFLSGEEPDRETTQYARGLIEGTLEAKERVDAAIQQVAQNWEIPRMAVIDRNVLRLATYELLCCPDIPPKVAINEAIELGKRYSTQNSGGFINGILDKVKDSAAAGGKADAPAKGHKAVAGAADKARADKARADSGRRGKERDNQGAAGAGKNGPGASSKPVLPGADDGSEGAPSPGQP